MTAQGNNPDKPRYINNSGWLSGNNIQPGIVSPKIPEQSMHNNDVVICGAARTPMGAMLGELSSIPSPN